jgi:tRNA A37 methylthiotransferase MiaB
VKIRIVTSSVCKRRQLLLETFKQYLIDNGHIISDINYDATVFYGCAFNTTNEKKSEGILIEIGNVVHLGGIGNLYGIEEKYDSIFSTKTKWADYKKNMIERGVLKIQVGEGCNDNCSYCGDKAIVGNLKSYDIDYIKSQIKGDYHTIELIGDDVGAWGQDIGKSFIDLLDSVLPHTNSLIMQEVNIKYLIKYKTGLERILKTGKLRNIVVAFQSGNDFTLKLMQRGYTKRQIIELIELLKKYNVMLRFHCILGFPNETAEMFKDTIDILNLGFRAGSVFLFQRRKGTKAYNMPENKEVNECKKLLLDIVGYKINQQEDKFFLRSNK